MFVKPSYTLLFMFYQMRLFNTYKYSSFVIFVVSTEKYAHMTSCGMLSVFMQAMMTCKIYGSKNLQPFVVMREPRSVILVLVVAKWR